MADEPTPTPAPSPAPTTPTPSPAPATNEGAADAPLPSGPAALIGGEEPPKTEEPAPKPAEETKADEPAAIDISALKVPEGVKLADGALEEFAPVAKDLGLNQEQAQKLLDHHVKTLKTAVAAPYQEWADTQTKWVNEVKADAEIGGDKWDGVSATVAKALDQFGDPAVRQALAFTGAGNNPAIIRTLYRMSQALTEGGHVTGAPATAPKGTGAHALYPELPQTR